ncbi:MAG: outer membrane beta-barrel protein [Candidatus Acidiferrales bacterium]
MQRGLLFCLSMLIVTAPAGAQGVQKFEVFGGYQYEHFNNEFTALNGSGWNASVAYHFAPWIGAKADFSGVYATDRSATTPAPVRNYTYTFGPVFSPPNLGALRPFGEALFGRFRQSLGDGYNLSFSSFALLAGGGLDMKIHENVALRLGEIDYLYMHSTTIHPVGKNNLRFSAGIVLRF